MRQYLILFFTFLALSSANQDKHEKPEKHKKSYVCPPNFMRLSNKCYYFSNRTATWQDAYWKCRDMHSNIATIKNSNQDKVLRRTLDHDALVPLERWVGGRYDWGTMSWKWAASGKPVQYQGFADQEEFHNKESLNWHCIILDPTKHYKWSSRICTSEKHYICQTKIRVVNNRDKKKLQKHYNNKLNEVPVPEIQTNYIGNETHFLKHKYHDNNELSNNAYALRPRETRLKKKNKKETVMYRSINGTVQEIPKEEKGKRRGYRTRRNKHHNNGKNKNHSIDKIKWRTYYEMKKNPQHPRVAVEEFNYR